MEINGKKISKELIAKAEVCETAEELLALAKDNGIELSAEQAEAYLAERDLNRLSEEELDQVAGGTRTEVLDIIHAVGKVHTQIMGVDHYSELNFAPGQIEGYLKEHYGIKANLSAGFLGTGLGESKNTYSRDGQSLTHQQVINIIKHGNP